MNRSSIDFHEKLEAVKPDVRLQSTELWVGVLQDYKTAANADFDADILWFKCRGKSTASFILKQYLLRFPTSQETYLQHNSLPVSPNITMAELNVFDDNVIAMEVVKKSNSHTRTSTIHREPLQPLISQATLNNQGFKAETSIKLESLDPIPGDENSVTSFRLTPGLLGSNNTNPFYRTCTRNQSTLPSATLPMSHQHFITECAMRNFIHEGLARKYFDSMLTSDTNLRRAELVNQWWSTPDAFHKFHEKRATFFLDAKMRQPPGATELIRFTSENAGFYFFFFEHRSEYDQRSRQFGPDTAFTMMTNDWYQLKVFQCQQYIERGRQIRCTDTLAIPRTVTWPERSSSPGSHSPEPLPSRKQLFCLQQLFANSSPDVLEAAVEKGVQTLEELKALLTRAAAGERSHWLAIVEDVQKQAAQPKTIIGVVGNTGAGKSSVINAMLDEERLVPTNCMRACTAVVTEISYNYIDDLYRAEVEFITRQDWERELRVLFQDLLDSQGKISREATNTDSEAGVAYAKIKAVYPKYTREMLQQSSVDELMKHENVQNILGQKRQITESESHAFYKRLQFFADSKEKTTNEKVKGKEKSSGKEMEYWPLIKVIRLYVKAAALETGAVVVDLPGVHDSNAARSAVAEEYIKQCNGLWIVAPITRAVDDKAAKSLLGESFKRRLQMDGGFNTVTFICSKTDDISLMECQESLGLEEMSNLWAEAERHTMEKRPLKQRLNELKETKKDYVAAVDEIDGQLDIWDHLKDEIDEGKLVFAPREQSESRKRKRGSGTDSPRKKPRSTDSDDDYVSTDHEGDSGSEREEHEELQSQGDPLTKDQIDEKLGELKALKKDARRHKSDLDNQITEVRKQISELEAAENKIQAEMSAIAISSRNEYSRGAIRQDFAAGIKELDQEMAEEQDSLNFDPDMETRDYDEVARSLPVFCVSSRAYQKLQGRLKKEPTVPGFQGLQETEVPQLQAHCRKSTENGREANSRRFLNSLDQLFNSLRLWSSANCEGAHLANDQDGIQAEVFRNELQKLDVELEEHIESVFQEIQEEFGDNIFDTFENAISTAAAEAANTVLRWNAPVNRNNREGGGYYWATYKAICRRSGVFSNGQGLHDWNGQLIEPIIKAISSGWERTFSRRIPFIVPGIASKAGRSIKSFHTNIESRTKGSPGSSGRFLMLTNQLHSYQALFKDLCSVNTTTITTHAKDINRMFQPVIAQALEMAYEACAEERGTGSFMRMKALMTNHIDQNRSNMFRESTNTVKHALKDMVQSVKKDMMIKKDGIISYLERDYHSALFGSNVTLSGALSTEPPGVRKEVAGIITESETGFTRLVNPEVEANEVKRELQNDNERSDANPS